METRYKSQTSTSFCHRRPTLLTHFSANPTFQTFAMLRFTSGLHPVSCSWFHYCAGRFHYRTFECLTNHKILKYRQHFAMCCNHVTCGFVPVCQESVESANTTIEDEDVKGKNISRCCGWTMRLPATVWGFNSRGRQLSHPSLRSQWMDH